jgi:hypothetical protein
LSEHHDISGPLLSGEFGVSIYHQIPASARPHALRPIWAPTVGPATPPELMAPHSHSKRGDHFVPIIICTLLPPSTTRAPRRLWPPCLLCGSASMFLYLVPTDNSSFLLLLALDLALRWYPSAVPHRK